MSKKSNKKKLSKEAVLLQHHSSKDHFISKYKSSTGGTAMFHICLYHARVDQYAIEGMQFYGTTEQMNQFIESGEACRATHKVNQRIADEHNLELREIRPGPGGADEGWHYRPFKEPVKCEVLPGDHLGLSEDALN